MRRDYKELSIYIDPSGNLLGVPNGDSKKYQYAQLDLLFFLKFPFDNFQLEEFFKMLFDKCYSEKCKDDGLTSIEKYYKVKSYSKAIKNHKYVLLRWLKRKEYLLMPSINVGKGFEFQSEHEKSIPIDFKPGELAEAFRHVASLST